MDQGDIMGSVSDYSTYIDESGDLGSGVGTKWFVLTAVMVRKEDEPAIRNAIKTLRSRLNVNEIHFRKIHDFNKRAFVVRNLRDLPFTFANIIIDTDKIDKEKLSSTTVVYNFACKILLERVSWFMKEKNGITDIVLSARGTSKDAELINYIAEKLLPYPGNNIPNKHFGKVEAKQAPSWDLLQLADVCATSMFLSYEKNGWGFTVPCHRKMLESNLYNHDGKVFSYGVKYMYSNMSEDVKPVRYCWPCRIQCK